MSNVAINTWSRAPRQMDTMESAWLALRRKQHSMSFEACVLTFKKHHPTLLRGPDDIEKLRKLEQDPWFISILREVVANDMIDVLEYGDLSERALADEAYESIQKAKDLANSMEEPVNAEAVNNGYVIAPKQMEMAARMHLNVARGLMSLIKTVHGEKQKLSHSIAPTQQGVFANARASRMNVALPAPQEPARIAHTLSDEELRKLVERPPTEVSAFASSAQKDWEEL